MKKMFLTLALVLVGSFAFASNEVVKDSDLTIEYDEKAKECTVTYTNSSGVTFTSTAETCTEAYENLMMHIEAN
ncbi:MAG: hypothetical protein KYX68_13820 [Flavobacterium sp.]|nr:hypothetical protein [Flavobacterium sp.]